MHETKVIVKCNIPQCNRAEFYVRSAGACVSPVISCSPEVVSLVELLANRVKIGSYMRGIIS